MINVLALGGGRNVPSTRFRIRQHIERLRDLGVDVEEYIPPIERNARIPGPFRRIPPQYLGPIGWSWVLFKGLTMLPGIVRARGFDAVWINRQLMSGVPSLERYVGRARVLDVDDAIWLKTPFVSQYAKRMNCVIAGNNVIADWFSQYCDQIHVIPTAIDTQRFSPRIEEELGRSQFVVGWTGTATNLKYLHAIEQPLAQFLSHRKDAVLRVVCDRHPHFTRIPQERVDFVKWSEENEADVVRSFDVGLMPLSNGPWERGKCAFKMLQYLACGIPACVSPVGMNVEVAMKADVCHLPQSDLDWADALDSLYLSPHKAKQMGQNGRALVEREFSLPVVSGQIAEVFHAVCGSSADEEQFDGEFALAQTSAGTQRDEANGTFAGGGA